MHFGWLLIVLGVLLLPPAIDAECAVGWKGGCNSIKFDATSEIFFIVNRTASNSGRDTYNATVTFHWGESNFTRGPEAFAIDDPKGFANTHQYVNEGYYKVGYTLTFHDDAAAGCSGQTYQKFTVVKMERTPSSCKWNAKTPPPTPVPTASAGPTASSGPTSVLAVTNDAVAAICRRLRWSVVGAGLAAATQSVLL